MGRFDSFAHSKSYLVMPNSYFQFKQFRIAQGDAAMKVSTDACIQGAWTPIRPFVKNVLDIGTGTGLLALMLAQKNSLLKIDAIELDEKSFLQALHNFTQSPWKNRLRAIQGDAKVYDFQKKYDLIICNPPFFYHSLKGTNSERNQARHTIQLDYENLLNISNCYLSENGYLSVLLPRKESKEFWLPLMKRKGFFIEQAYHIIPKKNAPPKRVVFICSKNNTAKTENTAIIIRDENLTYTAEYQKLMQPYYL